MEKIHRRIIDRLNGWGEHHPRVFFVAIVLSGFALALVITVLVVLLAPHQANAPDKNVTVKKSPEPVVYYSPLTGMKVKNEKATKQAVTAIMIENSPDARPQSGLKKAGVVFEAIAEGGITRFLALYQEAKPKLIGPVRSVRLYYVNWLTPFQASIAHVGGSAFALAKIRHGNYRDIDQFFNWQYYWRATDRWAPHNVYTSFSRLDALNKAKGYKTSKFTSWQRKDETSAEKPEAKVINVKISGPLYNVVYKYEKSSNSYVRILAGQIHKDREEGYIHPKVVIVMDTVMKTVFEDGWREDIKSIGSGLARVFQGGEIIRGKWIKRSASDQIRFVDANNKEIPLFRGQTWITAVPANQGGGVSWSK